METTRGKIAFWAFMILGITGICFQMYKYITNTLELSIAELIVTTVFAVFVFAPKTLSQAFGKLVDKKLK